MRSLEVDAPGMHDDPTRSFEATLDDIRVNRRRRARRRLRIAIAIPVVLLLVGTTFVLTQRNVTTTVSLDDVTANFRAEQPGVAKTDTASSSAPTAAAEGEAASDTPAVAKTAAAESDQGMFASLPHEGVYAYRASGGEKISVFGASHQYPERVYATVRHLGGCRWEHRNDVIEEHVDRRELCNEGGAHLQLGQAREVEFFGKRDGGNMRCDPPALQHATKDAPGATSTAKCVDAKTGDHATVLRTFLGLQSLSIDGRSVEAVHYEVESTFTGHATGTSVDRLWVLPETGMTLRWDRTVDTMANASFGAEVRYQEEASFVLESLQPAT
jgi:hypothetical protein